MPADPILRGSNGLVLRGRGGKISRDQDCCCGPCTTPSPVTFDGCGDETPGIDVLLCLRQMFCVLEINFSGEALPNECGSASNFSGSIVFKPDGSGASWSMGLALKILEHFEKRALAAHEDCSAIFGGGGCTPLMPCLPHFECVTGEGDDPDTLEFDIQFASDCGPTHTHWFHVRASIPFPIEVYSGFSVTLEHDGSPNDCFGQEEDDPCIGSGSGDCTSFETASATLKFFGPPCEEAEPCDAGPTAFFTLDNIDEDAGVDFCDLGEPADINHGCNYTVNAGALPGSCPIVDCFWSDGNQEGCERTNLQVDPSCGDHSGSLTMYAVDTGGCIAEHTVNFNCCNCCTPTAAAVTFEDEVSPINPPATCDGLIGLCNDGAAICHNVCYYKFIFGNAEGTDCGEVLENTVRYLVDWGGFMNRSRTAPLPNGCYDEFDEVSGSYDGGWDGDGCICIRITPVDLLGCQGGTQTLIFKTGLRDESECEENCV